MTDEKHTPTSEQYEQLYALSTQQALAEREAERRKREWPHEVEQLLAPLVHKVAALEARIAVLEAGVS